MTRIQLNRIITIIAAAGSFLPVVAQEGARLEPAERTRLRSLSSDRIQAATDFAASQRTRLQLSEAHGFARRRAVNDAFGRVHVRFAQTYKGLPVIGGEMVVHVNRNNAATGTTEVIFRDIDIDAKPAIPESEMKLIVAKDYLPRDWAGDEAVVSAGLAIYPRTEAARNTGGRETLERADSVHLVWQAEIRAGELEPFQYLVDAHSGAVLYKSGSYVEAGAYDASTGTGHSLRYGSIPIHGGRKKVLANPFESPYWMIDPTRGESRVLNMENKAPSGSWKGNLFPDDDNDWGDGADYEYGMSTYGVTGQTPAVEAMYAIRIVWDMLETIFGRDGLDDNGSPLRARVHARKETNKPYGDAYWDGTYANFGDGSKSDSSSRTDVGTIGHEFGHGLWGAQGFGGGGEAKGLNEGHGDIMGSLAEFYAFGANGSGYVLPTVVASWNWSGRMVNPGGYEAGGETGLSYYTAPMGDREEHVQGCAYGHMFVMLAMGSSADAASSMYSIYLNKGMQGIGVQKAADIWYLATTAYMAGTPTFFKMRLAYLDAAEDLFGASSKEYKAVQNAWAGINVGFAATDTASPDASSGIPIVNEPEGSLFISGSASDDVGIVKMEFLIDDQVKKTVVNTSSHSTYLDISNLAAGNHTVKVKVYDWKNKQDTVSKNFTLAGVNHLIKNRGFENGGADWTEAGIVYGDDEGAFLGQRYAVFMAPVSVLLQAVSLPADLTSATLRLRLRVAKGASINQQPELLRVQVVSQTTNAVLETLDTFSNVTDTVGVISNHYKTYNYSLTAHKGKNVFIRFLCSNCLPGRFRVDNVSLVAPVPASANFVVEADSGEGSLIIRVDGFNGISAASVKQVNLVINGQVLPMTFAPYIMARKASDFVLNADYSVRADIYNLNNVKVGQTETKTFRFTEVNQLIDNPGFEQGSSQWAYGGGTIFGQNAGEAMAYYSFLGNRYARLGGAGVSQTQFLRQQVYLPDNAVEATLSYRVRVDSMAAPDAGDKLRVRIKNTSNQIIQAVETINGDTDTDKPFFWRSYRKSVANVTGTKGQHIRVEFESTEDNGNGTRFYVDNVSLTYRVLGLTLN